MTSKGLVTLTVGTQTITIPLGSVSSSQAGAALTNPVALAALAAGQIPGQSLLAGVALLVQSLASVNAPPNNPVSVQATANAISLAVQAANDPTNTALQALANAALQTAITENTAAIAAAITNGIPVPAMSTALTYFDGYRCERLPANLLQAQRDFFGAHTYERLDKPRGEFFHTNWTGRGGDTASTTYNV